MAGKGGKREGAGRKSNKVKLLHAEFAAPFFGPVKQATLWKKYLNSSDERVSLDAAKYLTDRLYGKARQAVELSGQGGGPILSEHKIVFIDGK